MKIRHILEQKGQQCHSITPDEPVAEAVRLMIHNRIGSLVVMERGQITGIVTERDVVWAAGQHSVNLVNMTVRDIMAKTLVTCTSDDSLEHAMDLMTRNPTKQRIRHLPVIEGGTLVGLISIGDIVHALLTKTEFENKLLKNYIKHWPDEESA
jgi:CBS domain-containing protein